MVGLQPVKYKNEAQNIGFGAGITKQTTVFMLNFVVLADLDTSERPTWSVLASGTLNT